MSRLRSSPLTVAALVLAAAALFFSLGGLSWAKHLIKGSQIKKHGVQANRLTKKARRSLQGAPGTAKAYAYVNSGANPSLDPARTVGFTGVTSSTPTTETIYCLTPASGIDLATSVAEVTPVRNSGFAGTPQQA